MLKSTKKLIALGLSAIVAVSGINAPASVQKAAAAAAADAQTYNAYFGIQANESYVFRDAWYSSPYGLGSDAFDDGLYDTEDCKWNKPDDKEPSAWAGHVPADVTDALNIDLSSGEEKTVNISCVGSAENGGLLDWGDLATVHPNAASPAAFNLMFVSTDIPAGAAQVVNCVVKFDGVPMNVHGDDGQGLYVVESKEDSSGASWLEITLLNSWLLDDTTKEPLLKDNEAYTMPEKSIEIELTLKGVASTEPSKEPGTSPSADPGTNPSAAPSIQPTTPATGTTATGVAATGTAATGTAATKKLSVAKKSVIVAAGKSTNVKYTVTKTAAASKAAAVTVKSANKKIATAKKVSGKNQIKISVPKKATKGASTKITLKSGSKTAKVTVKVQNQAKKVKAAKKALTVKKGKKVKATFKVTAANKKKATTDKVTVKFSKKKIAKNVKTTVKKGKVIVTVKGLKKGKSTKMTVKVGKKSAKTTIKVK